MTVATLGAAPLPASGLAALTSQLTDLTRSLEQLVAVLQGAGPAGLVAPVTTAATAVQGGGDVAAPAASGCGCGGMQASSGVALTGGGSSLGANGGVDAPAVTQLPGSPTQGVEQSKGATTSTKPKSKPASGHVTSTKPRHASGGSASTAGAAPAAPTSGTPIDAGIKRKNPRSVAEMMDFVRKEVKSPHKDYYNRCGHFSAYAYGWSASGENYAINQWNNAPSSSKHTDQNPPAGALVFWKTGNPAGHVAISMGNGMVASNDIRRKGKIDIVPLTEITKKWGADYQGWTPPNFPKAA